jgi:ABC-2 type transport system permease protein
MERSAMSTLSYAMSDAATMLRRSLKRIVRYPSIVVTLIGVPVIFLLLFAYVFGGTLGGGLGGDRDVYINYVSPGIILMTVSASSLGTALSVAMDMTSGIIARFRIMNISRASVLAGHVYGSAIQTLGGVAVVTGVAVLIGFRPNASPVEWLAVIGVFVLITLALTWLNVALGLNAKSVESASNAPQLLVLLPFLGSGFVPTDSMPAGLRWFAEYQPFTPFTETVRGLLSGTAIGNSGWITIAWCVGITGVCYVWAKKMFNRQG